MIVATFLKSLFSFLNNNVEYAVLRNYAGLPDCVPSRDIDIILERKSFMQIKSDLVSFIDSSGWKIVTYLHSDRLVTLVCGNIASDGSTDLVQLDFFFNTSVYGIELMPARKLLENRIFTGDIYHVDAEAEFLDKYLYDRAVGAVYPEKYNDVRRMAEHSPLVLKVLKDVFGVGSVDSCDRSSSRKILLHAFLRSPLRSFCNFAGFEYYRIKNYLCSDTGFSIGFTGPDGVGKTTVIDMMIESLGDVFRDAHEYMHFRPSLFGNLGEVAHSAGIKKEVDRNYSDPHRGGKTGKVSSFVRLLYYSFDYISGWFVKVKSAVRITRIVVFDRYYTDIICDSHRSRIFLSREFLYRFGRVFIPSLDYNILLVADVDTIMARKKELSATDVQKIIDNINFLATKKGYYKVVNDSTPDVAVKKILLYVFDHQHQSNLCRLRPD